MKKLVTIFLQLLLIITVFILICPDVQAQGKGSFDITLNYNGSSRDVAVFVPGSYSASKKCPVIVGMHPMATPPSQMRMMMNSAAEQLSCILICPNDHNDYTGGVIQSCLDWLHENYNIDDDNIVVTGYSAGGQGTFGFGLENHEKFKGLIGIAPSLYPLSGKRAEAVSQIPMGFICGTSDGMYSSVQAWITSAESLGAVIEFTEKPGVAHTGEYFYSTQFTTDWIELYNFIQNAVMPPGQATLSSPENYAVVKAPVELKWEAVNNADSYDVQVSKDYSFNDLALDESAKVNSYTIKKLDIGANYYWRIRAKNSGGEGKWSDAWSFSTANTIPADMPDILSPDDGAEDLTQPVTLEWNTVDKATRYHLMIYEENVQAPVVDVDDIPAPGSGDVVSYEASGLTDGKSFTWKVRGLNDDGEGPWTEERSFSVVPAAPEDVVDLLYPQDDASKMTESIVFEWKLIAGADKYHFRLKKEDTGAMVIDDGNIESKGSKIFYEVNGLEPNTKYIWQVRGLNAGGEGPWSNEYSFTTDDFTGVEELSKEEINLNIKPNPAVEFVQMIYKLNSTTKVNIAMYNIMGEKVRSITNMEKTEGSQIEIISLSGLTEGIYLIRIIMNKKVLIYKLVISK